MGFVELLELRRGLDLKRWCVDLHLLFFLELHCGHVLVRLVLCFMRRRNLLGGIGDCLHGLQCGNLHPVQWSDDLQRVPRWYLSVQFGLIKLRELSIRELLRDVWPHGRFWILRIG